jgi:hypothetical protein
VLLLPPQGCIAGAAHGRAADDAKGRWLARIWLNETCGAWRLRRTWGRRMIRKLKSGQYRLYSRKADPRTGKRRNLGTFRSRAAAERHERAVQYFKRAG